MRYKVAEIEGALLDAAVAKARGMFFELVERGRSGLSCEATDLKEPEPGFTLAAYTMAFAPSQAWIDGGPIIEREALTVMWARENGWLAKTNRGEFRQELGQTPLIAAMRAYVASRFGEEVELP